MRIDLFLVKKGLFDSRTKSNEAIKRGEIFIDGKIITKSSLEIDENSTLNIERVCEDSFVSNGGFKMNKALIDFNFDVNNLIIADVGSSTGGFTDCVIKRGAKRVYAVDLNDTLLHKTLKENDKVIFQSKNAKFLSASDFVDEIDVIVADLSFISATQVLDVFYKVLKNGGNVILLIKPQFEADKKVKYKNGIVNDKNARVEAIKKVFDCSISCGFTPLKITTAPIKDRKNIEYLILLEKAKDDKNILLKNIDFNSFISKLPC